jgi:hypothetical protein
VQSTDEEDDAITLAERMGDDLALLHAAADRQNAAARREQGACREYGDQ